MKRFLLPLAVFAALGLFVARPASAGGYHHHPGHRNGHRGSGPIYHAPSVHFHQTYHPEYFHWTPGRGWHSHGHYHVTPHYVPGHYDYRHGNHIHVNPWYHH